MLLLFKPTVILLILTLKIHLLVFKFHIPTET